MNYYERHLGDYARDTGHLTMLEHGAYSLLLDRYYATESGIPADQAHRICRARSREERAAVDAVLKEFFSLVDGVWTQRKCESEIAAARTRIAAAKENGKKGGRPKKEPKGKAKETQEKPTGFSLGNPDETQTKALQAPSSSLKEKDPPAPKRGPSTFRAWIASIPAGVDAIPPDHHVFAYAERAGIPKDFLELAWAAFERRYLGVTKRYTDWPKVFRNAVEGNWGKLWWLNGEQYQLTTVGLQLQRSLRDAA